MTSANFTFVHSTGPPGLSQSSAKQMRSHITKTNFAKRRQRIDRAKTARTLHSDPAIGRHGWTTLQLCAIGDAYRSDFMDSVLQSVDTHHQAKFFSEFWSVVFLDGSECPRNPDEAEWVKLIASEPSLLQSTMAIGIRHWSPNALYQEVAQWYWSRATDNMIRHISSGSAWTDAVLLTVVTMAFGERLAHNDYAWGIHIEGLAQIIRHRYMSGGADLPSWLYDLLILDATNDVLGFPRVYHRKIVEAVRCYGNHGVSDTAKLCDNVVGLRKTIAKFHQYQSNSGLMAEAIEHRVQKLHAEARELDIGRKPSLKATSLTIRLILHLSWHRRVNVSLTSIAEELKQVLCRIPVRPCSYMSLTSCQLMIGAVAAEECSEAKAWFVSELHNAMQALQNHGSIDLRERIETSFVPNAGSVLSFQTLWHETIH